MEAIDEQPSNKWKGDQDTMAPWKESYHMQLHIFVVVLIKAWFTIGRWDL